MTVPSQQAIDFAEKKIVPAEGQYTSSQDGLQIEGLPFVVGLPQWGMTVPEKTLTAYREGVVLAFARLLDEYTAERGEK